VALHVVRLGARRLPNEGTRLGTVRHLPRGIAKSEYASRDYFDVWLPELAPSPELVSWFRKAPMTDQRWRTFARRYRAEMRRPAAAHLLALIAALSANGQLSVGCSCADESRCHRSLLRELLRDAGAIIEESGSEEETIARDHHG
jgi:uncharacterized protein YeaO (DUF488 family)